MPKQIIISNIPDEMYAHAVNAAKGSPTAFRDLSEEDQIALLGSKILEYVVEFAGAYATNRARELAATQVAPIVAALTEHARETVVFTVEEAI
ncbi:hypothetical protein IAD21_00866 [Abditibacteriota bacterium]|nr:hypothetical protein IAD21_00866 [Abditibacteriota bacterium]